MLYARALHSADATALLLSRMSHDSHPATHHQQRQPRSTEWRLADIDVLYDSSAICGALLARYARVVTRYCYRGDNIFITLLSLPYATLR